MKTKLRGWIAGMLVLAALAALSGFARGTAQSNLPEGQTTPSSEEEQVNRLRGLLQSRDLSDADRLALEEKLAMSERMAAQQAAGQQNAQAMRLPKEAPAAPQELEPTQALVEGIFEGSQGLVRPSLANITNVWQAERGGSTFQVFAGSTAVEPYQGLLIIRILDPGSPLGKQQVYHAPEGIAALRILEVQGDRLLLETEKGEQVFFDLNTGVFQAASSP